MLPANASIPKGRTRMRSKLLSAALGAALVVSLLGATGASAATQAGNNCTGNTSTSGLTLISLANAPGNPLPATIPVNGVITSWTFSVVPIPPGILSQTLKIFRPTGAAKQFQVIGESAPGSVVTGLNTFSTRIPVHAGDFIGSIGFASGEIITVYCNTGNPGDRLGALPGNPSLGSTATVTEEVSGLQNPITVSIEPDADNDGFGDETQDACPQSAAFQTACPPVALSTSKQVKKGSVIIIVTTSTPAPVTVKGVVKLGGGKKVNLKGGTKNLTPGTLGRFTLKFTKRLKDRLAELSTKQSLTLKATVTGTSVSGAVTKKTLKVKLKGQAKA
jgi:hypothetical protein